MLRGSQVCAPQKWSIYLETPRAPKQNLLAMMVIASGVFILGILWINRLLRLYFLGEKEKNEELYRDGGRKSPAIIICYVVSQMAWFSSFFYTSRNTAKYGIAGAYFEAISGALSVTLIAPLAVQLKTKAPGARTYVQVIYARFGKWPHIVFCIIALTTNVTIILSLLAKATKVLGEIADIASEEILLAVFVFTVGVCLAYGGISGIYTCSYIFVGFFLWFSLIVGCATFLDPGKFPLGSFERLFELITCQVGPEGNYNQSFLTFRSTEAAFETVDSFGFAWAYTALDQAYWQAALNSDPENGGFNLMGGALAWFPMPAIFGTACGLGYLALNMAYGQVQLNTESEQMGLMVKTVVNALFGKPGVSFLNVIILSSMATTVSAEVVAISNIFIYDVYCTYINPYTKSTEVNNCILCGKVRARFAEEPVRCKCASMSACDSCEDDLRNQEASRRAVKPPPTCRMHALYRRYLEKTKEYRLVTMFAVLGLVLFFAITLELGQVLATNMIKYVGVFGASTIGSLYLTFYWARVTRAAVLVGIASGTIGGIVGYLASHFTNFPYVQLGNIISMVVGFTMPLLVTLVSTKRLSEETELEVWERTRAIDNPLQPWPEYYATDLGLRNAHLLTEGRPRLDDVQRAFGFSTKVLNRCVIFVIIVYAIILPGAALISDTLNFEAFQAWMHMLLIWLAGSAIFCFVMPIVFEVENIYRAYKRRQEVDKPDSFKPGQAASFKQTLVGKMKAAYDIVNTRIGEFDNENGLLEIR